MAKYRAQIIWDFDFDEDGYTVDEREHLEGWLDEGETLEPRTEDELVEYAKTELLEAILSNMKYGELYQMIDVVPVD